MDLVSNILLPGECERIEFVVLQFYLSALVGEGAADRGRSSSNNYYTVLSSVKVLRVVYLFGQRRVVLVTYINIAFTSISTSLRVHWIIYYS